MAVTEQLNPAIVIELIVTETQVGVDRLYYEGNWMVMVAVELTFIK